MGYGVKAKIDFKKLVSFFLFWIFLSGVSFANECPVQEFKQYAETLNKVRVESIDSLQEIYKKTAFKQSKQCRLILFRNFRHYYDQMIQIQAYIASVEEKLTEKFPPNQEMVEKYNIQLSQLGLIISEPEGGMHHVEADCTKRDLLMVESNSDYFDASFKCCRASTNIEKYICSDKELADMDKEMGILYLHVKMHASKNIKKVLLKKRRTWVKNRKKDCHVPDEFIEDAKVVQCLKDEYLNKTSEFGSIFQDGMK